MTANERFVKEVKEAFNKYKGKGSLYCIPPFSPYKLIADSIVTYYNKHNRKVLVVIEEYCDRQKIIDAINTYPERDDVKYTIMGSKYINPKYRYGTEFVITLGINKNINLITKLYEESNFMLCILTQNIGNHEFINSVRNILPNITTTVTPHDISQSIIYSPVEEHQHGVELSEEDRKEYNKCTEFINICVAIFGNLKNIEYAKQGNQLLNISGAEFRHDLAIQNGWSPELDTTIPFNRQIDENYNPNSLYEKACTFYNIAAQRRNICTDNKLKLEKIKEICVANKDKKILIVSKRGEFAAEITKYLDDVDGLSCVDYHDCIEDTMLVNDDGTPVLVKSGVNKGKPRIIKSKAVSTFNLRAFNNGMANILSIKFSSDTELKTAIDLMILTDGLNLSIIDIKTKFTNIIFNFNTIVHKVYSMGTIEEKRLMQEQPPQNVTIIRENENNLIIDEKNGDIIW